VAYFYNLIYTDFNSVFNSKKKSSRSVYFLKTEVNLSRKKSLFFLISQSPWPVFSAFSVFIFLFGFAGYLNFFYSAIFCVLIGFFLILMSFLN
jgi:hypothetical protein